MYHVGVNTISALLYATAAPPTLAMRTYKVHFYDVTGGSNNKGVVNAG
jgi:hypothetical protein